MLQPSRACTGRGRAARRAGGRRRCRSVPARPARQGRLEDVQQVLTGQEHRTGRGYARTVWLMVGQQGVTSFSATSAAAVLERACASVGLGAEGAELLRLGENAIFRLSGEEAVVRIGRSLEHWGDAGKEVAVARWLAGGEVAVVSPLRLEQPLDVDGHPVTFWQYLDGRRGRPEDVRDLAAILRQVHRLPAPTELALPQENPLKRVEARIARAQVPEEDQAFLRSLLDELSSALPDLAFALEECVIPRRRARAKPHGHG